MISAVVKRLNFLSLFWVGSLPFLDDKLSVDLLVLRTDLLWNRVRIFVWCDCDVLSYCLWVVLISHITPRRPRKVVICKIWINSNFWLEFSRSEYILWLTGWSILILTNWNWTLTPIISRMFFIGSTHSFVGILFSVLNLVIVGVLVVLIWG